LVAFIIYKCSYCY